MVLLKYLRLFTHDDFGIISSFHFIFHQSHLKICERLNPEFKDWNPSCGKFGEETILINTWWYFIFSFLLKRQYLNVKWGVFRKQGEIQHASEAIIFPVKNDTILQYWVKGNQGMIITNRRTFSQLDSAASIHKSLRLFLPTLRWQGIEHSYLIPHKVKFVSLSPTSWKLTCKRTLTLHLWRNTDIRE